MTITVANTKGGVGKTTTSIMLAAAAAAAGRTVELWDADPQGSATSWAMIAEDNNDPLPFEVRTVSLAQLERLEAGKGKPAADLLIVDTPPGAAPVVQSAINAADLVVIPTQTTPLDMQRVWQTLEVSAHRPRAVLITGAAPRTKAHSAALEALIDSEEPVFETVIPKREGVRAEFGQAPKSLHHYNELLTEIEEVTK